jgi:hypothetical protein
MRINAAIALLPMIATACCLLAADKPSDAAASLAKVKSFSFGGIGAAGIPSQSEAHFRTVLDHHTALAEFRGVLANGTPEAKLYALCGIRILDPSSFNEAAEPLKKSNPTVETIGGCIIWRAPFKQLLDRIKAGEYDHSLSRPFGN